LPLPVLKPTPPDPEALITQRTAYELLDWSPATIRRFRFNPKYQRHNFPKAIEINGRMYFRRAEILAWMTRQQARSQAGSAHSRDLAQEGAAR
jgi:predicted DNA-binding transcriptional regulator AlpA